MSDQNSAIRENFQRVRERIARAAERVGRRVEEVTLVAVSKTFPAESIRAAYGAGLRHFGENRVQEWESERPFLDGLDATWHLYWTFAKQQGTAGATLFVSPSGFC